MTNNQPLAYRILNYVREAKTVESVTVPAIAEALHEDPMVVGFVIDGFAVDEDDKISWVGAGQGGGWIKPNEELAADVAPEEDESS